MLSDPLNLYDLKLSLFSKGAFDLTLASTDCTYHDTACTAIDFSTGKITVGSDTHWV
jgi:hypothetical protein